MQPDRLGATLSEEERACGFVMGEGPLGVRVPKLAVRQGLWAVKVRAPDGEVEYAICDAQLHPIYRAARSLEELRARFPPDRR